MKRDHRGRGTAFGAVLLALASLPTGTTEATSSTPAGCASPTALCLSDGRFAVEAAWKTADGSEGVGHPVPLVSDSGYFWFFEPDNVELAVKTLNGCGINGHYWLFAGGLTDVEVTLTVTDTVSGEIRTYASPLGQVFQPITDTAAFPTCSDTDAALSIHNPEEPPEGFSATVPMRTLAGERSLDIGCDPSGTALCVKGRFQIEATWQIASGASGPGYAVPLTSEAGYFWFFQPSNLELITKTLDACSIGGGQWFFAAGLTDVGVELTITDTYTGDRRFYSSQLGTPFVPVLDTSAFSSCFTPTPTPTSRPTVTPTPRCRTADPDVPCRNLTPPATPTPTPTSRRRTSTPPPTPTPDPGLRPVSVRLETDNCLDARIVPSSLSIHSGETVRWTAGDCRHHLVTSGPSFSNIRWDSGIIQPGSSYERNIVSYRTTLSYRCTEHEEKGTIHVQGPVAP